MLRSMPVLVSPIAFVVEAKLPPGRRAMTKHKGGTAGPHSQHLAPPWWRLRRPWPGNPHFEDGETERVLDRTMPPPELPVGTYASTGALCTESRFAEGEFDDRVGI
jgi:hypothetical protein